MRETTRYQIGNEIVTVESVWDAVKIFSGLTMRDQSCVESDLRHQGYAAAKKDGAEIVIKEMR